MRIGGPPPPRPSIRRRHVKRESNKFVVPIIIVSIIAIFWQMAWMQRNWGTISRRTDYEGLDADWLRRLQAKIIVLYECDHCSGSGLVDDVEQPGRRALCDICQGVGYQPTRRFTDADRMCINCGGMGRHYNADGQAEYCPRCQGRGLVEIEEFDDVRYPERIITEDF